MSLAWFIPNREKRQASVLNDVRVASPCPVSWEQMSGTNRIRHCAGCNMSVFNLSDMTEKEAVAIVAGREGRLCVRFYRREDGTVLTRDCPVGLRSLARRVSHLAGAALSAAISLGFWAVDARAQKGCEKAVQEEEKGTGLALRVTDPVGAEISGAQVTVTSQSGGAKTVGATKSNGRLWLPLSAPGSYRLRIALNGFKAYTKQLTVERQHTTRLTVALQVQDQMVIVGRLVSSDPDVQPAILPSGIPWSAPERR